MTECGMVLESDLIRFDAEALKSRLDAYTELVLAPFMTPLRGLFLDVAAKSGLGPSKQVSSEALLKLLQTLIHEAGVQLQESFPE